MHASPTNDYEPLHLSTNDLPAQSRIARWREVVERKMLRVDIDPLSDTPFQADVTLRALPALRTMLYVGCDFRMRRTREIVSHSDDAFGMVMNLDGIGAVSQCGRDVSLRLGDAATITNMELATYMHSGSRHIGLIVPRAALTPMVPNLEDMAGRLIPRESEALRLLVGYLQAIQKDVTLAGQELRHLSVTHVHDLLAVSIGATREGAALAERRGLRAARLRAIKADIARNSGDERLTVAEVAARQRITPRYVQSLFKMEDTTFSEFLLQQRLARAYRMLMDLRHRSLKSSTIAFEVGFGDLSYFHRTFRRRYGATPSDVRKMVNG